MEIFIPTVANKYTKKRGSSFLVYSVDSNQRLCCITTWLHSYLTVTINRQLWQGAVPFPSEIQCNGNSTPFENC